MKLPPISEKEFMAQVVQLANLRGWNCFHVFDSRKSAPGWPDLVMVRGPRIVFAELKRSKKEKLTAHQQMWLALLMGVDAPGATVCVLCPEDWSRIEKLLE